MNVKTLGVFSTGCTKMQQCQTPDVPEPVYDTKKTRSISKEALRCKKNLILSLDYSAKLKEANEVCK